MEVETAEKRRVPSPEATNSTKTTKSHATLWFFLFFGLILVGISFKYDCLLCKREGIKK